MSQLKHLLHPEEELLFGNFQAGHDLLLELNNVINYNNSDISVSYKMDGSPAIVFGYHPITKKFFVGTKSVFNNSPKINYTEEDIESNHGNNLKLTKILKLCLELLPSIIIESAGIYQGDVLFIEEDKQYYDDYLLFKANIIEYQITTDKLEYKNALAAKLGIAIHTKYTGEVESNSSLVGLESSAFSCYDLSDNELVYIPRLYVNASKVSWQNKTFVEARLSRAQLQYNTLSDIEKSLIVKHGALLKMFYNHIIKNNIYEVFTSVSPSDYYEFLEKYLSDNILKYKTQKLKDKHIAIKFEFLSDLTENVIMFMTMMFIYDNMCVAKNFLVNALNTLPSPMRQYINNESTGPEGYVVCSKTAMSKLVLRHEFSKHNFINFQQKSNL